jgi:hypothetical protein
MCRFFIIHKNASLPWKIKLAIGLSSRKSVLQQSSKVLLPNPNLENRMLRCYVETEACSKIRYVPNKIHHPYTHGSSTRFEVAGMTRVIIVD